MTRNTELSSINCTSCGAGLDVLGGGRVVVQVCSYCGAELDALDNYRTLRQFKNMERPKTPFAIGMTATLFGAEFTIIGLIAHAEQWAGRFYRWIDHQLYSPTHGYAWLTLNDGHLVFTRRYRGAGWMSEWQVETSEQKPSVYSEGETFVYYETTVSEITYVEGEFTWSPRLGEKTVTVSAMSQDAMMEFSQKGSERETYRSVYVPTKTAEAAFRTDLNLSPYRVHPLQPFVKGPNYHFLLNWSLVFASVCLCMALYFNTRSGYAVIYGQTFALSDLPAEITLPLNANSRLTQIDLTADVRNSWAYMDIALLDPQDVPVFQAGRTIEYYSGRDADGNWAEGSRRAKLKFRPQQTGDYTLLLEVPEQGLWTGRGVGHVPNRPFNQLKISVTSGLSSGLVAFALAAIFGALSLFQIGRNTLHDKARWSGSDWVEED